MSKKKIFSIRKTTMGAASIGVALLAFGGVNQVANQSSENIATNEVKAAEVKYLNRIDENTKITATDVNGNALPDMLNLDNLKNGTRWYSNVVSTPDNKNIVLQFDLGSERLIDRINFNFFNNINMIRPDNYLIEGKQGDKYVPMLASGHTPVSDENNEETILDKNFKTNSIRITFSVAGFTNGNYSPVGINKVELKEVAYDKNVLKDYFRETLLSTGTGYTKESYDVYVVARANAIKLLSSDDLAATTDAYLNLKSAVEGLKADTTAVDSVLAEVNSSDRYKENTVIKKLVTDLDIAVENKDFAKINTLLAEITKQIFEADKAALQASIDEATKLLDGKTNKNLKDAIDHANLVLSSKEKINKKIVDGKEVPVADKREDVTVEITKLKEAIKKFNDSQSNNSGNGSGNGSTTPDTKPEPEVKPDENVTKLATTGLIKYVPGYSVLLRDANGKIPANKQYLKHGTNWKVNAKKVINGVTYYRLGNDNQWIEAKYLLLDGQQVAQKSVVKVVYNGRGAVLLRNQDGSIPTKRQYVQKNSSWKVFALKNIKGQVYYKLGTNAQWIPAEYVKFV